MKTKSIAGNVKVTENQIKVIKDKYLRDSPTIEAWLKGVCDNIALGELLHDSSISKTELLDGVWHEFKELRTRAGTTSILLLHNRLQGYDDWQKNFNKFLNNLENLSNARVKKVSEDFYRMLSNWEFLPNSPTLMNAGRDLQQLSACYVLPVEDSIEGIYESVKNMALIHKSGGGTGFSFSRLRPSGDIVKKTKGISSGPLSFMQIFDKSTDVVKQGGTRRGANMGMLRYDHPDILNFIEMKKTKGVMENFNVSVSVDKYFMEKVKREEDYDLLNPRTGAVEGTLNAREVFDLMVKSAWESGDPGMIFIDRINESESNPTPHLGDIEATNPCGEQPLMPYEPCNLGSINLAKFVLSDGSDMDWKRLREVTKTATHFLDNVIEVNNFPIPQIELMAKSNRRIGLGVMGWAETLVKLGLAYNSPIALKKAEEVMKFVNDTSLKASEELASVRGVFPNFDDSIYDEKGSFFKGKSSRPRHSARTTIAPTGTIAIASGLQGSGIEPFFAVAYVRYNAKGIDFLKAGKKPMDEDTFFEINPLFESVAKKYNYFGLAKEELYKKINENHKSVKGIDEVPQNIQDLFLTSHDLNPTEHVLMQSAFQNHTNNAVSKTVNFRKEASVEDVNEVYWLAYEKGLKGITVYRDGSKDLQILNLSEKSNSSRQTKVKRGNGNNEQSEYYRVSTGYGALHIHINYDEVGPLRMFVNINPAGSEISGLTTVLGIIISKYLESGGDPINLMRYLNSIKGDRPLGMGPNRVDSIPHAISKALKEHLTKTGKFVPVNGQKSLPEVTDLVQKPRMYCSQCFSPNVQIISGCSEPSCLDCGYSKCS